MIVHGPGNRESALFSFMRGLFSLLRVYRGIYRSPKAWIVSFLREERDPGCAEVTMSPLTEARESPALPLLVEANPGSPGSERKGRDL